MSKKISELTAATDVTANDFFQVVDPEDLSMSPSGTNKKISASRTVTTLDVAIFNSSSSSNNRLQVDLAGSCMIIP